MIEYYRFAIFNELMDIGSVPSVLTNITTRRAEPYDGNSKIFQFIVSTGDKEGTLLNHMSQGMGRFSQQNSDYEFL